MVILEAVTFAINCTPTAFNATGTALNSLSSEPMKTGLQVVHGGWSPNIKIVFETEEDRYTLQTHARASWAATESRSCMKSIKTMRNGFSFDNLGATERGGPANCLGVHCPLRAEYHH